MAIKRRTLWILAAGVAAVAIGAAAVGALALVLRRPGAGPIWGGHAYLRLDLGGELPEEAPAEVAFFARRPTSLRTVVESLDRAAHDGKVNAVVVRVGVLADAGWGKVQEVRDAIVRFRKSGKPAYAHIEFCGNKEYYVATACSKIYAVPTALVGVSGLSAEVTFFRKTLDKLGVEAQFEGVGKYKNAPNTWTESSFTEPHREQMEALVDSLYDQYLGSIASARGLTREEAQAAVDGGPYDGEGALRARLVDELVYQDEVSDRLRGADSVTPGRYVKAARGLDFDGRPKVALVYAVGDIMPGESEEGAFGGAGFAGSDTLSAALREARGDDSIKAIVLRIDSPGGFGPAADVIRREVQLAQKAKPVIVSMGDLAASGGYYITIGSDTIVAQPGTITGSIGVFSGKFSLRGLYDKIGVSKEIVSRGRNAAIFTEYRPWSAEERAKIRSQNEAFYHDFVRKVAEGRRKPYEEIHAVAQGRVWTGVEALQRGLVDRLGGLDTALALAREKARIAKDAEISVVILPARKGFFEAIWERQQEEGIESRLPSELRALLRYVRAFAAEGPMARLPFDLRIR